MADDEHLGYTVVLHQEPDYDGITWVATVPELPGCMAAEDTPELALKHVQESMKAWIEVQSTRGGHVPAPSPSPSGKFTVRVLPKVHRQLKLQADAYGISLNQYVSTILANAVGYEEGMHKTVDHFMEVLSTLSGQVAILQRSLNEHVLIHRVFTDYSTNTGLSMNTTAQASASQQTYDGELTGGPLQWVSELQYSTPESRTNIRATR